MAPLERVLERAVAPALASSVLALEVGVALETLGDLADAERRDACCYQLDRERHPVEPQAELGDRLARSRVTGLKAPGSRLRALHEQRDRAFVVTAVVADDAAEALDDQPRHPPHLLATDPKRLRAGDDHPQRRDPRQQVLHELRDAELELLAVVEHQQRRARQLASDRGFGVDHRTARHDRRRDRLRDELGVGRVAQVGPPGAGDEVSADVSRERRREARLAGSAGAGQRQQPRSPDQRTQLF